MSPSEQSEAIDVPVSYTEDSAAEALSSLFASERQEEQNPEPEGEGTDDPELELDGEEQEEQDSEPEGETPAIAPPVSLNADEKKAFAQLPPEAQQLIADVEGRRNAQVQEATTKASEAQRTADARAAQADAEAKGRFAQQLDAFVAQFAPTPPDYRLAQTDPASYIAQQAQYDALKAHHETLVEQVKGIGSEAQQEVDKTFLAERDRALLSHPQIANPETRDTYIKGIMDLAKDVGFAPDNIAKHATGEEVLALAKIYDRIITAETKAAKYDQAMSKQMQRVRAAKGKTLRPSAAQPDGSGSTRAFQESTQRLRQTGSVDDAAASIRMLLKG